MQFVKVIEARTRICDTHTCFKCPLSRQNSGHNLQCHDLIYRHPKEAETIIKNWLKSHKEEPTND